jgi:AGZA family xanthine/uracil permease-like MFS transporter
MLARWFRLGEHGVTVRSEIGAGVTTFLTMSYIIFVQPGMLAAAPVNMDAGAVTAATCVTSAVATLLMGAWARYPIALAPGMGINAYFAYVLVPVAATAGHPEPWRAGLAVVFAAGVLFLLISGLGVRERLMRALSPSLRHAIAVGIGLFITFIGLRNAGLIVADESTLVRLTRSLASPDIAVAAAGLAIAATAAARRIPGAILLGIAGAASVAAGLRAVLPSVAPGAVTGAFAALAVPDGIVALPPSLAPTFLQMDLAALWLPALLPYVLVFLFIDVLDTLGTLVGVSEQACLLRNGELPRARQAFASDALATVAGACLGTSTVTSYIESAAGVAAGGRTGLVAVTVAALFLLALLLSPVIAVIGAYPPLTAPALVMVGIAMLGGVSRIDWHDPTESVPALLIVLGIPLAFSIGDGIALGLVAYPALKALSGRAVEVHPALWVVATALAAYLLLLRA